MNAKISVFVICVKVLVFLSLSSLRDSNFFTVALNAACTIAFNQTLQESKLKS